jgi:hypothetical protein
MCQVEIRQILVVTLAILEAVKCKLFVASKLIWNAKLPATKDVCGYEDSWITLRGLWQILVHARCVTFPETQDKLVNGNGTVRVLRDKKGIDFANVEF